MKKKNNCTLCQIIQSSQSCGFQHFRGEGQGQGWCFMWRGSLFFILRCLASIAHFQSIHHSILVKRVLGCNRVAEVARRAFAEKFGLERKF